MPEHLHYNDEELFNPETHHEKSDVNVRALLWFMVIFVVFAAATHALLWLMFGGLAKMETRRSKAETPLTEMQRAADAAVPKNQPLLQPFPMHDERGLNIDPTTLTPVTDLDDMRRREDAVLKHYGWVDKPRGVVHIPIEEAKRLALAQMALAASVPAQTQTTTTTTTTTTTEGAQ